MPVVEVLFGIHAAIGSVMATASIPSVHSRSLCRLYTISCSRNNQLEAWWQGLLTIAPVIRTAHRIETRTIEPRLGNRC